MARRKAPVIPDAVLDQLLAGAEAPLILGDQLRLKTPVAIARDRQVERAAVGHHPLAAVAIAAIAAPSVRQVLIHLSVQRALGQRFLQAIKQPVRIECTLRIPGFDEKIVAMYARGMSTREIASHVHELYGIEASADLISTVTDAVLDEVATWQARPLEAVYPVVFLDALRVKIRDEGLVRNKAVHVALGVRADGVKEILGLWIEENEGAKFWLKVMNELKTRGVEDILIAVVDGLKGFPDAIQAVFPNTLVQTCIVHLTRNSLSFVSWKDRKAVAAALKAIYRAVDAKAGEAALAAFEASPWHKKYPAIVPSWRRAWTEVIPFFAFPPEVRRIIYTTNAIEALNSKLRTAVRARGHFPSDDAALKLLFLVLNRAEKEWTMPAREWCMARAQFAVLFGERFSKAMA